MSLRRCLIIFLLNSNCFPPFFQAEKGGSLSKGSTAWTFGLFSDSPSHPQRRQVSSSSVGKSKSKAASVAPSPELVRRSFTPPAAAPALLLPGFLARNERRTRSLERCSQQRVRNSAGHGPAPTKPPPIPSRVRSRSLEKNYQISTNAPTARSGFTAPPPILPTNPSVATPLLPSRRNNVPPEVLATWCTFNEAFGGGRPKHRTPTEPLTVNDERDSPGSPVFEELFLPPPHKFAAAPPPIVAVSANATLSSSSSEFIINNNNNNKRNSVAGSCCCSCGGSGQHSAGVSCSSKSTPRSSPVPPAFPETVLYGTREAPVLERHCVEGGEFIIAWLSHSSSTKSGSQGSSNSPANRAAPPPPPPPPLPLPAVSEMQSSSSAGAAAGTASNGAGGSGSGSSSNRSFINKPARGWLHSDVVIVREGITYFVRVNDFQLFSF